MRKTLSAFLACILILSSVAQTVFAAESGEWEETETTPLEEFVKQVSSGDLCAIITSEPNVFSGDTAGYGAFEYELNDKNQAIITGYNGSERWQLCIS